MELIISGNPNLNTIQSVVFFVNTHYDDQEIEKVYFIDNKDSIYARDGKSLEGKRNKIVRKYLKDDVKIESALLERRSLHQEIPRLLSEQLMFYDTNQIIVDLTNGTKYISNILYASSSLSKIENLFFLYVSPEKQNELPEELNEDDYVIEVISPLENLEAIGKYTYFELIYYGDRANRTIESYRDFNFQRSFLENMLESQINSAVSSYFLEKYPETIMSLGQIVEELSLELCPRIKQFAKGQITSKNPADFDNSITWLRTEFCDPLRGKSNRNLCSFQEDLKLLQNIDKLIDTIRVYRNLSSHPYDFLRGREEARLILNTTLYLLDLIAESGVFK